jgi:hypothetical protein
VRSFQTNARIRSLTTGTFNRVVKDRIALRRSGANSVQANSFLRANPQVRIRLSSKPYKHTLLPKPCQRKRFTEYPRDFHSWKIEANSVEAADRGAEISPGFRIRERPGMADLNREAHDFSRADKACNKDRALAPEGGCYALYSAQRYGLPLRKVADFGARAEAEDRKLRKDLTFGGPCFEGTLQKPTGCFRIKSRGRDN